MSRARNRFANTLRPRRAMADRFAFLTAIVRHVALREPIFETDLMRSLRGSNYEPVIDRQCWSFGACDFRSALWELVANGVLVEKRGRPTGGGIRTTYTLGEASVATLGAQPAGEAAPGQQNGQPAALPYSHEPAGHSGPPPAPLLTHRELYPAQYAHPLVGKLVHFSYCGVAYAAHVERVVESRFGPLAIVSGGGFPPNEAVAVSSLKEA